jgi:hypothetical protein
MDSPLTTDHAMSSPPRFEYFRGYPARFAGERRSAIRGTLGCAGPFFLASWLGFACSVYAFSESAGRVGMWGMLGLLGFAIYFSMILGFAFRVARQTSIVPYFQQEVGDIHSFAQGHAVARSCQMLDELALQLGLTPLSAFSFNDDLAGETVVWHPSGHGLATFSGLLAALHERPNFVPRQDQLFKELTNIVDALKKATNRNIPFSLLLRVGDSTSSLEWERRKGTCF